MYSVCVLVYVIFNFYIYKIFIFLNLHWCLHVCLCERISGTGITDRCEQPCGFWELSPGSSGRVPVLLTSELPLVSAFDIQYYVSCGFFINAFYHIGVPFYS